MTMHAKLKEPKKFQTPAPNKYEAIIPEEQPSFAFGVKHSPYMYSGKQVNGDHWVSTKTETFRQTEEEFRPRSGTFTRDKPTVLRSTAAIRQSQAVAWEGGEGPSEDWSTFGEISLILGLSEHWQVNKKEISN